MGHPQGQGCERSATRTLRGRGKQRPYEGVVRTAKAKGKDPTLRKERSGWGTRKIEKLMQLPLGLLGGAEEDFADGSTWGDPNWITILLLRRSSALKYEGEAMRAMEAASMGGSTRKDLVQQLTQRRSDEIKAAGTTAEKQMADASFSNALLALQDSRRTDGGDIPLSESIAHARSRLLADTIRLQASKPAPIN